MTGRRSFRVALEHPVADARVLSCPPKSPPRRRTATAAAHRSMLGAPRWLSLFGDGPASACSGMAPSISATSSTIHRRPQNDHPGSSWIDPTPSWTHRAWCCSRWARRAIEPPPPYFGSDFVFRVRPHRPQAAAAGNLSSFDTEERWSATLSRTRKRTQRGDTLNGPPKQSPAV